MFAEDSELNQASLMSKTLSRREMLQRTGRAAAVAALGFSFKSRAAQLLQSKSPKGAVIGEEIGAKVGERILAEGGNAIDAAVAAALMSCVATPSRCGVGGYGGHMTLALKGGKKVTSIDFNTMAPAAASADMYPLDDKDQVQGRKNFFGWLAVGVPGTLAGLQLALERYGTRTFRELVQPAIDAAENGVVTTDLLQRAIRSSLARFRNDPGSFKLYLKDGQPLPVGERLQNLDLAKLLHTLAERNSVDSFYRGDIAQRLADEIKKNGGIVTAKDLANYHAREVEPLKLKWNEFAIFTAPLTAGGLTVLQALSVLKQINWAAMKDPLTNAHARLEAMRLAWKDRLTRFGDPEKVKVPVEQLLSAKYIRELASKVEAAVRAKRPVEIQVRKHTDEGTNNICSIDAEGNMVAITLTQGGAFGAQVTADGLGLTLGHGMSRFDPHPDHPNAPAPGKRPLHNMCPSVVLRDGKPLLALGGAGGVRIPNAIYDVLGQYIARGLTMENAITAPRLNCTGTLDVLAEQEFPKDSISYLTEIGFKVQTSEAARISAVTRDAKTGECRAAMR
jgi:gamma-glutamyltranspeptidase / glutathione hydrolase